MPVLPWRSLAGLPRYAAGYSGMMELAALCGVPGGVALGRGTPFKAPSRSAGIGFGPQLSLYGLYQFHSEKYSMNDISSEFDTAS